MAHETSHRHVCRLHGYCDNLKMHRVDWFPRSLTQIEFVQFDHGGYISVPLESVSRNKWVRGRRWRTRWQPREYAGTDSHVLKAGHDQHHCTGGITNPFSLTRDAGRRCGKRDEECEDPGTL
jgi:hypothetical protein